MLYIDNIVYYLPVYPQCLVYFVYVGKAYESVYGLELCSVVENLFITYYLLI